MAWWVWALIVWAAAASVGMLWLAAICARKRAGARGNERAFGAWELLEPAEEPPLTADSTASGLGAPAAAEVPPAGGEQDGPATAAPPPVGPTTQPLPRRPLPGPTAPGGDGDGDGDGVKIRALGNLIKGSRAGNYTLPEGLITSYRAYDRLRRANISPPAAFDATDAAGRMVVAATAGESVDPVSLCREVHRSRGDQLVYREALAVLDRAVVRAAEVAVRHTGEATEQIIVEHLRPAHVEVIAQARAVAARLGPYTDDRFELDTARIMTATVKARKAYLALAALARRHGAILAARGTANAIGDRTPRNDQSGLFAMFEAPLAFARDARLERQIPQPLIPEDETRRLLWFASERAAIGRPWFPTVAEQDAAWSAAFRAPAQPPPLSPTYGAVTSPRAWSGSSSAR
jgi:hypothetical protein